MSSIFQYGYKVRTDNLIALTEYLNTVLAPIRNRLMAQELAQAALIILDGEKFAEYAHNDDMLLHAASKLWIDENANRNTHSTWHDILRCRIDFLQTPEGEVLAPVFVSHKGRAYIEALNDVDLLEEYGVENRYSIATDRDSIRARDAVWIEALDRTNRHHNTLGFDLPYTMEPLMCLGLDREAFYAAVVEQQYAPERRLEDGVKNTVLSHAVPKLQEHFKKDIQGMATSDIMHVIRITEETIRQDTADITAYGTLPAPLTTEDLQSFVRSLGETDFHFNMTNIQMLVEKAVENVAKR